MKTGLLVYKLSRLEWEGSIVRGSSALKRLEEERLTQLANQAKQYITLMEEYRYITLMEEYRYITLMEEYRYSHSWRSTGIPHSWRSTGTHTLELCGHNKNCLI